MRRAASMMPPGRKMTKPMKISPSISSHWSKDAESTFSR
jgi:hypothetical protein